ncbi:MAG: DUF3237 domain-containing protein [Gammaproteobacteria bacterium]
MKLELLMTYHANLGESVDIGAGAYGSRMIVEVHGGAFEGEKLRGKFRDAGAADWLAVGTDGFGHLDVRATMETDDGAFIYLQYNGKVELTEAAAAALAGNGETDYGDHYFFTTPRFQTGHEKYAWMNNIVCVSQGRLKPNRVEYNVYQVVND